MAGAPWGVACYVIFLSLVTALAVWWGPETNNGDLADDAAQEPMLASRAT